MDGSIDCVIFSRTLAEYSDALAEEKIVKLRGKYDCGDRGSQFKVSNAQALSFGRNINIELDRAEVSRELLGEIKTSALDFPGNDKITLKVSNNGIVSDLVDLPLNVDSGNVVLMSTLSSLMHGRGRVRI